MSGSKPKQQKSLLSFFSPPSRASSTAGDTPSSAPSSATKATPPKADPTRKRIDFSPKDSKKEEKTPQKKAKQTPTKTTPSPSAQRKRKAQDDAVEPASETEKDVEMDPKQEKVTTSPADNGGKLKRLRKAPIKVIEDDDDDDDEEGDKEDVDMEAPANSKRVATGTRTKSRNVVSSEEEWDPDNDSSDASGDASESEASVDDEDDDDEDDDEEEEEEEDEAPAKKPSKRAAVTPAKKLKSSPASSMLSPPPSSKSKPSTGSSPAAPTADPSVADGNGVFGAGGHIHDSLPWLNEKRRDINGNAPDSPDYDPRTIKIPAEFLKKETPAMSQWWDVKQHNMDTVLFFKVGKFYELFHMDADVGFKELDLIYMKGEKAHSGFPETAYGKYSSQLVAKGYRVARVEQTETPEMLKERNAKSSSKAKVVRREVCSLLSQGTNTLSFLDAPISKQPQAVSSFLMAVKEHNDGDASVRYGVCLADCATGAFHLAEFDDTEQRDRLKTLFAQFHVVEVVNERGGLSVETKQVIKFAAAPSVVRSELIVGREFWDAHRTLDEINRAGYFKESGWPEDVLGFLNIDKSVREEGRLAISAFGGCIWHLRRCIIDQELVSLGNIKRYKPSDEQAREVGDAASREVELAQQYVVLDSQTIQNLEILTNSYNGSRKGSLIDIMDKTMTAFGKRLFQDWVLKPLCKVSEINERLDAVEELGGSMDAVEEVRHFLGKLPDLERLLSRIHALGSVHRSQEHPDSRAIMYESSTYNIRKIRDFLAVLNGFDTAMDLLDQLGPRFAQFKSPLLHTILKTHNDDKQTSVADRGHFPDLREKLQFFKRSFDQTTAAKSGVIVPQEGADPEYDDACDTITGVQQELEAYLQEQRKRLKCPKLVNYWGTKKDERFQLEVPESVLSSGQPKDYELKSRKKGYKRFHTATIRELLQRLTAAETRKELALKDQMRRIFHKFDMDYKYWMKAVQCLAVLDCLLGLAIVSSQSEGFVRPEIVSAATANEGKPFIEIEQGVHPCVAATFASGDFIPNDTTLGVNGQGQMMVLSGPNMGGKSTLLRQTCVLALMAQVGCFVPAAKCKLSPVDRIFTRIGASDRILAGQSTLYVELAETATILNHATSHSLVILDELGRGTSTFDGTAIAYSVVEYLLKDVACRALFATHYHSLVEEYEDDKARVSLGHMGCLVDPQNERKVTFLYKLEDGMCPKSYGLNVAMLAQLPDDVIELAAAKSQQFEQSLTAVSHREIEALQLTEQIQQLLHKSKDKDHPDDADLATLHRLWEQARALVQD